MKSSQNYKSQLPDSKSKVIKLKPNQFALGGTTIESPAYASHVSPKNQIGNFVKLSQPQGVYKHFNPKARHSLPVTLT